MKKYTQQEMDEALEAHTATLLQRVEEMREDEDICGSGIHNKAIDSVLEAIKQPKEK